jgi:hypothetical protein
MAKKKPQAKHNRKKSTNIIYVNGEIFSIKGLMRKIELDGQDPKTYRTHPDYYLYMKELQNLRSKALEEKRAQRMEDLKAGKIDKKNLPPLTNHPEALNLHLLPGHEENQDKKIAHTVRKQALETLSTMEMVKKITKSKIPKALITKTRSRKGLTELDSMDIDLSSLEQITKILSTASKAQLEVAVKILDFDSKKALKKGLKDSIRHNNKENPELAIDFNKINIEEEETEHALADKSEEVLLKNLGKYFN